jgi:hypothetical protein
MLFVNRYFNLKLRNILEKTSKFNYVNSNGLNISYKYIGSNNSVIFNELSNIFNFIDFNYGHAKQNNLKFTKNFFLENKNYNFQKDVEYKYYNNIGLKDQYLKYYTFIFYYNISPNIEGGEIEFENGAKYKPSEFEVLCFDNESKYKINKVLNKGTISTLIMNLEKK